MTALENFVATMKKSDEISTIENEQKDQIPKVESKLNEDEQHRFRPIIPPLIGKYHISI